MLSGLQMHLSLIGYAYVGYLKLCRHLVRRSFFNFAVFTSAVFKLQDNINIIIATPIIMSQVRKLKVIINAIKIEVLSSLYISYSRQAYYINT